MYLVAYLGCFHLPSLFPTFLGPPPHSPFRRKTPKLGIGSPMFTFCLYLPLSSSMNWVLNFSKPFLSPVFLTLMMEDDRPSQDCCSDSSGLYACLFWGPRQIGTQDVGCTLLPYAFVSGQRADVKMKGKGERKKSDRIPPVCLDCPLSVFHISLQS